MSRTFFAISLATALLAVQLALAPSALAQASEEHVTPELRGMKKREGLLGIITGGVCVPG